MRRFAWLLLLLPAVPSGVGTAAYKNEAGPFKPANLYEVWKDPQRDRDVPVKIYYPDVKESKPFAVIIFSHGLGGTREAGEAWGRHWAGHGYVSVHLQHAGSDAAIWQQGGDLLKNMRSEANALNLVHRAKDVKFAIDRLTEIRDQEDHPLHGRLDLERIGMSGHSFGAGTTLTVSGQQYRAREENFSLQDHRIKAAIALSPPLSGKRKNHAKAYGQITLPMMTMTGTKDTSPINDTQPEDREVPYRHMPGPDKYLVVFKDGDHMVFSGRPRRRGRGQRDPEIHRLIRMSTTAFWDAYLRSNQEALEWLRSRFPGEVKEQGGRCEMKPPPDNPPKE